MKEEEELFTAAESAQAVTSETAAMEADPADVVKASEVTGGESAEAEFDKPADVKANDADAPPNAAETGHPTTDEAAVSGTSHAEGADPQDTEA